MRTKATISSRFFALALVTFTSVFTLSASDVTLRVNLEKGAESKYRTTNAQVITQTMGGMQQVINQTQTFEYKISVTDKEPNGNLLAKVTYTRIAVDMAMQGNTMSFDSDKDEQGAVNPQFTAFKAMVNKSIVAKVSPRGEVLEVTGVEEMLEAVLNEMAAGNEAMKTQMKQMLGNSISADAMKQMFGGAFIVYPEKSVKTSTAWTENTTINSQFTLNVMNSYTVSSIDADGVKIAMTSTMSTIPGNKSNMMGMEVTYNLFGTTSGTISVNAKTGMISSSLLEQIINGNLVGDMMGQKMDIPMNISSKTTTELIK